MLPEARLVANRPLFGTEFAEVLERLESDFYTKALAKFSDQDFKDAGIALSDIAVQNFQAILEHETAHTQLSVPFPFTATSLIDISHLQLRCSPRGSWGRASSRLQLQL